MEDIVIALFVISKKMLINDGFKVIFVYITNSIIIRVTTVKEISYYSGPLLRSKTGMIFFHVVSIFFQVVRNSLLSVLTNVMCSQIFDLPPLNRSRCKIAIWAHFRKGGRNGQERIHPRADRKEAA
jgi:hypothetical protein